jgi:hypothetical protein
LNWANYLAGVWLRRILTLVVLFGIFMFGYRDGVVAIDNFLYTAMIQAIFPFSQQFQNAILFIGILSTLLHAVLLLMRLTLWAFEIDSSMRHTTIFKYLDNVGEITSWVFRRADAGREVEMIVMALPVIFFLTTPVLFYKTIESILIYFLHKAELRVLDVRKQHVD